jgi:tetratricopeptide (TPR) repeat protein
VKFTVSKLIRHGRFSHLSAESRLASAARDATTFTEVLEGMRRRYLLGLLGWMVLATIGIAAETPKAYPPTTAEERARHRRIWEAVDEWRLDDAQKLAGEAVAARADNVEAHFALAHIRMQRESRVDNLLRDLRARLKREPKNPVWPVVLVRLGVESRFWEDEPELHRLADRAVALAPDWGWSQFAYGEVLRFYAQRKAAADEAFRRAYEQDSGNPVFVLEHGWRLEGAGRYDEAEKRYAALVKTDPEESAARRQMWRARCMQRPVAQFRAELDAEIAATLAEFPKSAPLYREAAYFYGVFLRDTARAEPLKAEAARLSPNAGHRYGYRLRTEVTRIGTVRTVCVTGPAVRDETRFAAIVTGPPAERFDAMLAFLRPMRLTGATERYFESFFFICVEAGKPGDAEAVADRLTAFDRSYLALYGEVARGYLKSGGDAARALMLAQRAAAAKLPRVTAPVSALRTIRPAEINQTRDRLFARNADALAWALIANGKEADALASLRASINRLPTEDAFVRLGRVLERRGDARGAIAAYADAVVSVVPPSNEAKAALAALVKSSGAGLSVETAVAAATDRRRERERTLVIQNSLVNRPAPELRCFPVAGGSPLTSETLNGRVAVLHFWETAGNRSRSLQPYLTSLYERLSRNPDFAFVSLNLDGNKPETREFLKNAGLPFPVYDGFGPHFDFPIYGLPTCVVLDRRGRIRYVSDDFDPVTGATELDTVVQTLLAESKGRSARRTRPGVRANP